MKTKKYILWFLLLFGVFAMTSCGEGSLSPYPAGGCSILVRFETQSGVNIIDSLKIVPENTYNYNTSSDDIQVEWSNANGGIQETDKMLGLHWTNRGAVNGDFYSGMGTVLYIGFGDSSITSATSGQDDVYTIKLVSKRIFGDDKEHTIKYYVHIKYGIDAYKCEVDGVETTISGPKIKPNVKAGIYELYVIFKI